MCRVALAFAALALFACVTIAAPPALSGVFPPGGQRGQTVTVAASGAWSKWPVRAWSDSPDLTITPGKKAGELDVKIAADARAVPRWIRIFDDEGASELRPFVVGALPEAVEKEPNDDPKQPHRLDGSSFVVNGKLAKAGDVDGFAVPLKKGQTLVASVDAARTLRSPMDVVLQIVSPDGFVAAQNDDHYGTDPHVVYSATMDGDHIARVFAFPATPDSSIRFSGNENFVYRLTLTTGGFPDYPFPLAVTQDRDKPLQVGIVGWNLPAATPFVAVVEPVGEDRGMAVHPVLPRAIPLRLEPHATGVVSDRASHDTPMPITLPITLSGRMLKRGVHVFEFKAMKEQKLVFEAEARELDSPLDPVLRLTDAKGKSLAEAQAKKLNTDPTLSFTVPADGTYRFELRDLHEASSPRHFYRLRALLARPEFTLAVASDRLAMSPGTTLDLPVTINRLDGFAEDVVLSADGLPAGVQSGAVSAQGKAKSVTFKITAPADRVVSGPFQIVGKAASGAPRAALAPGAETGWSTTQLWLTTSKNASVKTGGKVKKAR